MAISTATGSRAYNGFAKLLHWAVAALVAAQFAIGWTMPEVHKGTQPVGLIGAHVVVGVLIVLLVAARVAWRALRPPTGEDAGPAGLRRVAAATHIGLYLLMIAVPVLGWANANSRDWTVGAGPVILPRLAAAGSKLGHDCGDIHSTLAVVFAVLIGLHVAAALYHQFILRDGLLQRMR